MALKGAIAKQEVTQKILDTFKDFWLTFVKLYYKFLLYIG